MTQYTHTDGGWAVPGYAPVRTLGEGAGGRVALARHTATGVPVAVKYLSERLRADREFLARFRAEARLLGELRHPCVVRLYEYVEARAGAAIVMEAVDGVSLRQLLRRRGATGPEAALVLLKGSLLGLGAAHTAGVVHRDYKPENVLVRADGTSALADFGIAVRGGRETEVAGTPAYMAPEQWNGEPAGPAADVYAASVVFFECLTGRRPFPGDDMTALRLQHLRAPAPLDDVPEPVRALLRAGLAKDPADRPGVERFLADLERSATEGYGTGWEERGRRRLAELAALLALLFPFTTTATLGPPWPAPSAPPGRSPEPPRRTCSPTAPPPPSRRGWRRPGPPWWPDARPSRRTSCTARRSARQRRHRPRSSRLRRHGTVRRTGSRSLSSRDGPSPGADRNRALCGDGRIHPGVRAAEGTGTVRCSSPRPPGSTDEPSRGADRNRTRPTPHRPR